MCVCVYIYIYIFICIYCCNPALLKYMYMYTCLMCPAGFESSAGSSSCTAGPGIVGGSVAGATSFLCILCFFFRHLISTSDHANSHRHRPPIADVVNISIGAVSREEQDERQRQLEREERAERQRLREEEDERQRQLERQERQRQRLREEEERQRRNRPSTFYHATNLKAALVIQDAGFRVPPGPGGCLGPGVYCTATLKKAFDYLDCEHGGIIFELKVDLGRCLTLQPNDPRMRTWQEDFDSAWHRTGAVNSAGEEKEENCVKDPRKIKILRTIAGHIGKLGSAGYKIDGDRIVRR